MGKKCIILFEQNPQYSILNTPGKLRSARCSHPLAISILAESVPLWQDAQAAPHSHQSLSKNTENTNDIDISIGNINIDIIPLIFPPTTILVGVTAVVDVSKVADK